MASLATHFSAFLFLFPLGTRRLVSSFSLYLTNPSSFKSKTWYFQDPKWKTIDFYILLITLPIASFSQVFLFLAFTSHPVYRFTFLQQSVALFLFWLLVILIVSRESLDPFPIPEHFIFVFAAISFLVEYSILGKDITGLGEAGYQILGGLTLVCGCCCFFLAIRPSAFFAEFLLCVGMVMKGTWILQIGLLLYTDAFAVKGCEKISVSPSKGITDVKCELEEDRLRGMALMNLLFIGHVIVVLGLSFVLFGLLCRSRGTRSGEASGPLLAQLQTDSTVMHPLPEFEIE